MKQTILVYCWEDSEAAKALAVSLRNENSHVIMCAASAFDVVEHHADRIEFAKDVPQRFKDKIAAAHGLPMQNNIYAEISNNLAPAPFVCLPDGQELAGCKMFQVDEKITVTQPKKRGWPKGKPRKAA